MKIKRYIKKLIRDPKSVMRKIDDVLLGGRLKKLRHERKEKKRLAWERYMAEHAEEYYDLQVGKTLQRVCAIVRTAIDSARVSCQI